MTLDRETIRYRKSQADGVIYGLLVNRLDPRDACIGQRIAQTVFPESDEMSNQQFASSVGFCKRVMGARRQRVYNAIATEQIKPTYFPFPFRLSFSSGNGDGKEGAYWAYFNCIESPWYEKAIRRMQITARGLNNAARLLDSVSSNGGEEGEQ
jgi:hypothetical protein